MELCRKSLFVLSFTAQSALFIWAMTWQNQQCVAVRPAKTQISLGIQPVWSESSLCIQLVAKDPSFLHADNKGSDQTGWMPRLIWVFAGHTLILLVLSCRGSFVTTASPSQLRGRVGDSRANVSSITFRLSPAVLGKCWGYNFAPK